MTDFANGTTPRVLLKLYLASDHLSDATGKTLAVTISKNGGAFGNPSAGATNATEIANGWYYVDLSATDTGTNGPLIVRGTSALCDNSERCDDVVPATNGRLSNLDAAITTRATPAQILTTALTESYAADGVAPTLAQALFLTMQSLTEFAISGTTITAKKLDGSTTAATFTIDSATLPTSRTRAT